MEDNNQVSTTNEKTDNQSKGSKEFKDFDSFETDKKIEKLKTLLENKANDKTNPLTAEDVSQVIKRYKLAFGDEICKGVVKGSEVLVDNLDMIKLIEEVKVGDRVLTDNGWRKVLAIKTYTSSPFNLFSDDAKEEVLNEGNEVGKIVYYVNMMKIHHEQGIYVCTANSFVAVYMNETDYCWIRADKIKANDKLYFPVKDNSAKEVLPNKLFSYDNMMQYFRLTYNFNYKRALSGIDNYVLSIPINITKCEFYQVPISLERKYLTKEKLNIADTISLFDIIEDEKIADEEIADEKITGKEVNLRSDKLKECMTDVLLYHLEIEERNCYVCNGILVRG